MTLYAESLKTQLQLLDRCVMNAARNTQTMIKRFAKFHKSYYKSVANILGSVQMCLQLTYALHLPSSTLKVVLDYGFWTP